VLLPILLSIDGDNGETANIYRCGSISCPQNGLLWNDPISYTGVVTKTQPFPLPSIAEGLQSGYHSHKGQIRFDPIDYLCLNHTPDSATVIKSVIVQRIQWLGLAQWKADMLAALDSALAVDWSSRQREIGLLYFKLAIYERLEAISMLELALWKVKIEERKLVQNKEHLDDEGSLKKRRLVESDLSQEEGAVRQSCRITSGAEVVISNVLPFLDNVNSHGFHSED
jgi:hypothetical protein